MHHLSTRTASCQARSAATGARACPSVSLVRPDVQPVAPGQLYLNDVVSAWSWCSTAAPGAPGTAGALPAFARILGSAHTPVPSAVRRARSPGCHFCPSPCVWATDPACLCPCVRGPVETGPCNGSGLGTGRFRTALPAPRGFVCNKRQSSCRGVPVCWLPVSPGSLCMSRVCTCPGALCVSQAGVCAQTGLQGHNGVWSSALGSQIPWILSLPALW